MGIEWKYWCKIDSLFQDFCQNFLKTTKLGPIFSSGIFCQFSLVPFFLVP